MSDSHAEHTVVVHVTPGEILDERWRIETRIGQGAMGSVFKGRDLEQGTVVAIKILAPEHCRKQKVLARFEREAGLMTTLRHPNIVLLHGHGRRGALPYIVMEHLEGMTLADVLTHQGGKLPLPETVAVVKQLAAGLDFLHQHGLVHRDVKPQNVFLCAGGRVTILDLGVVRDQANPGLTKPGAMVGTPYYMSPEQILGAEDIDLRTDVYALGALTFEVLTGRPPFLGSNNFEVLYAHKNTPPPDAAQLVRTVPRAVAQVVQQAMAKRREDRPPSAAAFAAGLEAAAAGRRADLARAFAFLDKKAPALADDAEELVKTRLIPRLAERKPTTDEVPMARSGDVQSVPSLDPVPGGDALEEPEGNTAETELYRVALPTRDELPKVPEREEAPAPAAGFERDEVTGPTEAHRLPGDAAHPGTLRVMALVKGRPATAMLLLDGFQQGITPRTVPAPAGRHQLRLELPGYKPLEKAVDVGAGEVVELKLELVPA